MKAIFRDTFMTKNGWLAGWKCMNGELHDYGFLAVNGQAVSNGLIDKEEGRCIMARLLGELKNAGFDSFDLGLPGNIFDIGNKDMARYQHALPHGGYQNGGVTLSQARHFINGLYAAEMTGEADFILGEMCKGLLYCNVVGGTGSGVDWKTWDGAATGYEGLLCDQFGIFEPLCKQYLVSH